MTKYLLFLLFLFIQIKGQSQPLQPGKTATYDQCIAFYKQLDEKYEHAKLITCGLTDIGRPLHLFVISNDGDFTPSSIQMKNKRIFLINNGIHPGEPDGIDASMKFADDLLSRKIPDTLLNHVVICIIPVYNIDGALNRGCCSRANQNGPEEYGFRGNAKNLDLNRDFIKCDAENTRSFTKLFREWDPDVFVDTHVSDGADYQYTMTLISTQHNKLNRNLGGYVQIELTPLLFQKMQEKNDEMIPYVNSLNYDDSPEKGITEFLEIPRFSTGYAALYNTIGFVSETHMLKPFDARVKSTYNLLESLLESIDVDYERIGDLRKKAKRDCASQQTFPLQWTLDTTHFELVNFKGYEAKFKTSTVTGQQRMYYDHNAPYGRSIKFFNQYKASVSADKPAMYIIPQAWTEVIDRMKLNKIELARLSKDTTLEAEVYYIENYATSHDPYEGHYLHSKVEIRKETQALKFYKGDYVIHVDDVNNRYIVETLEPQGVDSWFAWGFFDAILQQKEWFSDYVYEEKAEAVLKQNPELKVEFETKQKTDTAFAKNANAQLAYIFQHSPNFEKTYKRYPVARLNKLIVLPLE